MTCNVGSLDRWLRLALGLVLVALPLLTGFAAATAWLWWAALGAGVIALATAGLRFCPLYALLGLRTCRP